MNLFMHPSMHSFIYYTDIYQASTFTKHRARCGDAEIRVFAFREFDECPVKVVTRASREVLVEKMKEGVL